MLSSGLLNIPGRSGHVQGDVSPRPDPTFPSIGSLTLVPESTLRPLAHRPAIRYALLTATTALFACGGAPPLGEHGGLGGGDSGSVGNGGGGGGGGGDAPLSGRLWHNNYALDYVDGTQISTLSAPTPTALLTGNMAAIPWPDGSQYVTTEWDPSEDTTVTTVRETSSGNTLYRFELKGYLRNARPSPADKAMVLATWGDDSVSPARAVFIDLAQLKLLDSLDANAGPVHWLPDGRYLRVTTEGRVEASTVGGAPVTLGQLTLPTDRTLGAITVSGQGTQMTLRLMTYGAGSIETSDIWVANIDGSALAQVTDTKMSSYARWSPDGQYIAFDVDTGLTCSGYYCAGSCGLWYVPSGARSVRALPSSNDAFLFRVLNRQGAEEMLGCELLGWTR